MALADLTSHVAVHEAMDEYDRLGRSAFLTKYKSGGRHSYFAVRSGVRYESKPIVAAAHGFQFGMPLDPATFLGGAATVARKLGELGFQLDRGGDAVVPASPKQGSDLEPGQTYSWEYLGTVFAFKADYFSVAGGMISRPGENVVLLVTHPGGARSFDYGDYWDKDDLIYTGRGQKGNQERVGANRDVAENRATLLVFEPGDASRELVFIGRAVCVDEWTATAPDRDEQERHVLRFRLRFQSKPISPTARRKRAPFESQGPQRQPRRFDPSRAPRESQLKGWKRSPEEILSLQEKARQGHHRLLTELAAWLEERAWENIQEIEGAVDLWATRASDRRRVLFEAKTLGKSAEVKRARAALAQLLEYRYFYGDPADGLCIVTDGPLTDVRCRMLDSFGVGVVWRDRDSFRAGSGVAADLLEGGGEPN